MQSLPTPASTLWKVALFFAVITGVAIFLDWDFRLIAIGAIVTVLVAGLYVYTVMAEKKQERIKKEAERLKRQRRPKDLTD